MNLTKEAVMLAVFGGAASLSGVFQALGGKGNVSGGTTKKMREMIPGIGEMLADNKASSLKPSKNSKISLALKAICPDVYEEHFPTVAKVKTPKAPKAVKSPSLKGKDRIVMTYQKTGNPFKAGTLKHVFFSLASPEFRAFSELKVEIANNPKFIEACGEGESLEKRIERVEWQKDNFLKEANSKGATAILKDEEGKIKAVCLA